MAGQLNEFSSLIDFMKGVQAEDLAKDAVGLPMGNLSGFFSRGGLLGMLNNPEETGPQNIQEQLRQQINGGVASPQEEQFIPGQIIEENVGKFPSQQDESLRFGTPPPDLLPGLGRSQVQQPQSPGSGSQSLPTSKRKQLLNLIEIQRIDPKMAALTMKIIQSGQEREIKAAQREVEGALQESNALLRLPDEMLNSGIADIVKERAQRGLASPRLIKAAQESDPETKRELLKLRRDLGTKSSDTFKLRQEEIKAKSTERLEHLKSQLKREEDRIKRANTPLTDIGKARQDFKSDLITKEDLNKLANVPTKFQSKVGKLMGDRRAALDIFGKNSPQVKAFDEVIKSETKGEVKLSDVKGVRGDFMKLSGDFMKIGAAFKKVNSSKPTPAGDLSLIFNFMKILDPTSVVREGEFATAASAGPLIDSKTLGVYNRIVKGDRLLPSQRKDFKEQARVVFASQIGEQLKREEEFTGIAERAGMNPKDVVLDFVGPFRKIRGDKKIGRFKVKVK